MWHNGVFKTNRQISMEFSFLFFFWLKYFCFSFVSFFQEAAQRREQKKIEKKQMKMKQIKVKAMWKTITVTAIQAHTKAVLSSDSFLQLLSPQSAALAHSRSSSKQTSCASGHVKLSCLCLHLLCLGWLNLNIWEWNCPCQVRDFFIVNTVTTIHARIFFFSSAIFSELIKTLFESCAARWAF